MHTHGAMHLLRHAPATQPATPQLPVHTPAGQQGWAEDVGNQVRWMLGRAESKAELVLTPPNMGKLEVSINLAGDQTTAQFIASSQAARDALERAMPQLREALQQAGIMLGDANVSTSSQGARR
jgi:flagellar hook-length control protein FliK